MPTDSTSGSNPWDGTIKTAYQQYTGRTPTAEEMIPHYSNPGGLGGVVNSIKTSKEATDYAGANPSGATPPPAPAAGPMPDGIDPRLAALYSKHNFTPTGDGSGFGDWKYWQGKMTEPGSDRDPNYFLKRLDADLAGTGTDQPTGTVGGNGLWKNSGAGDRGQVQGGLPPGATVGPDGMIVFGAGSPQASNPQDLLNTLLAKYKAEQEAQAASLVNGKNPMNSPMPDPRMVN